MQVSRIWKKAQQFEKDWWGTCQNTFGEETKQFLYASKMGLKTFHDGKSPFNFDMKGKSVLDIGGGPVSLLLKCQNLKKGKVVDPCKFPRWVKSRYKAAGIEFEEKKGEDIKEKGWDEVWIYNVLQHVEDPKKVIENAKKAGRIIRIFEWVEISQSEGHLHTLTEERLNEWLGGEGKTEVLKGQNTCFGKCYYGIFKGDSYEEI